MIKDMMNEKEAAEAIGVAASTLRKSRWTGFLAGVQTPAYLKVGQKVMYQRSELERWIEQFQPAPNTAAHKMMNRQTPAPIHEQSDQTPPRKVGYWNPLTHEWYYADEYGVNKDLEPFLVPVFTYPPDAYRACAEILESTLRNDTVRQAKSAAATREAIRVLAQDLINIAEATNQLRDSVPTQGSEQ